VAGVGGSRLVPTLVDRLDSNLIGAKTTVGLDTTTVVERGDVDPVVSLLADDRLGENGALLTLIPTRANGQPAFGCYLPDPHPAITRAHGLIVLTLEREPISAITWFGDLGLFPYSSRYSPTTSKSRSQRVC
jgi:hypothetical protein